MLLERTTGARSLAALTWNGGDDEASQIICSVASRLHAPRPRPLPELIPLERWFEALPRVAAQEGGKFARAYIVMRELLESPRDVTPLHGDLHHDNILDGGERGWLAIDPKRLRGERGFDFANIFSNPDVAEPAPWRAAPPFAVATAPGRLARQAHIVAEAAGLERERLLKWWSPGAACRRHGTQRTAIIRPMISPSAISRRPSSACLNPWSRGSRRRARRPSHSRR